MAKKEDPKAPVAKEPEKAVSTTQINPSAGKTIDERMADLLAEHKQMGARP